MQNASVASNMIVASRVEYVINRFMLPPTVIFGLIGNTFNLIILSNRKSRNSSAMVMLIAMSILDLLNLLIQIPQLICNEYRYRIEEKYYLVFQRYYYAFVIYPWGNSVTTGVALLSAAVAIDRFAAIKNVRSLYRIFHKHSTKVTAGIIISSVLVNIFKHFELRPIFERIESLASASASASAAQNDSVFELWWNGSSSGSNSSNSSTDSLLGVAQAAAITKNEFMVASKIDSDVYRYLSYWGFGTIQVLLPMTLLIIFGGIVVVTFFKIRSHQKKAFGQDRNRKDGGGDKISFATKMVIATIVVFILCNWTSVVLIAAVAASGRVIMTQSIFFASLRHINNYLTVAHSSINFLLYCTTCSQYRAALKRLFSNGRKQNPLARILSNQSAVNSRLSPHIDRQCVDTKSTYEDSHIGHSKAKVAKNGSGNGSGEAIQADRPLDGADSRLMH